MNANNDARKKLIEEINNAMFTDDDKGCVKPSEIADFILERERKIVEPLVKLNEFPDCFTDCIVLSEAIERTLKRAGLNS